jgi:hypothetical protein
MDQVQLSFHSFYRITSIEYTKDGFCMVGVQVADSRVPRAFKLSQHCYQLKWLKHFHKPDLETIWELAKQQPNVSPLKRMLAFSFIKGLEVRDMLIDWEEEAKKYIPGVRQDYDDW